MKLFSDMGYKPASEIKASGGSQPRKVIHMTSILLILTTFAVFAFGYYVVDRIGNFMDENYRRFRRMNKSGKSGSLYSSGYRKQR